METLEVCHHICPVENIRMIAQQRASVKTTKVEVRAIALGNAAGALHL
jgi:hypothetical protein